MTELPKGFTHKSVIEVDYNTLNDFIANQYGIDNFEGTLGSPNDSTHSYTVIGNGPDYEFDEDSVNEAIESKGCEHYGLGIVLNDLCKKEKLPPGEYLVSVCW
jgi:hypothetical protein